jgi:predicted nuclease with TOPRIM domain
MSQEARANQADSPEQMSTSPSGGEVDQLNARIAELEAENARLLEQQGAITKIHIGEVAELNARIAEVEAIAVSSADSNVASGICEHYVFGARLCIHTPRAWSEWKSQCHQE